MSTPESRLTITTPGALKLTRDFYGQALEMFPDEPKESAFRIRAAYNPKTREETTWGTVGTKPQRDYSGPTMAWADFEFVKPEDTDDPSGIHIPSHLGLLTVVSASELYTPSITKTTTVSERLQVGILRSSGPGDCTLLDMAKTTETIINKPVSGKGTTSKSTTVTEPEGYLPLTSIEELDDLYANILLKLKWILDRQPKQ